MTVWTVPAKVERIIDGDTIEVTLDLGWGLYKRDHVRIAGINAPEKVTAAGKEAKAFIQTLLPVGADVTIVSKQLDKYGRALAEVLVGKVSVGPAMVAAGHAKPWDGQGQKP
jgi:endonuclease YncB( thermonuclease family)